MYLCIPTSFRDTWHGNYFLNGPFKSTAPLKKKMRQIIAETVRSLISRYSGEIHCIFEFHSRLFVNSSARNKSLYATAFRPQFLVNHFLCVRAYKVSTGNFLAGISRDLPSLVDVRREQIKETRRRLQLDLFYILGFIP